MLRSLASVGWVFGLSVAIGGVALWGASAHAQGAPLGDEAATAAEGRSDFAAPMGQPTGAVEGEAHSSAEADLAPADRAYRGTISGDLAFFAGSGPDSAILISPLFFARYILESNIAFEANWGLSFASSKPRGERDASLLFSNPGGGVFYYWMDQDVSYKVGGSIALPLASTDSLADVNALAYAAATRGQWNYWLWAEDAFTLAPSGKVRKQLNPEIAVTAEGALALLLDMGSRRDGTDALFQVAGEAEYAFNQMVRAGMRLQSVWFITNFTGANNFDHMQFAFEPFVRVDAERNAFASLSLLMNLDKPAGFAFDEGGVWGLRLGAGKHF